ncbi:MAG TPA: KEOPS complex subunit Pcc1 [Thermoplasmata archaeon]|nr:KEOPS complex subunit Pcc1 [Thermoplasmata archaeon]
MHEIVLRVPCGSSARSKTILSALAPELGESVPKSRVSGGVEGETLIIIIESPELAALRAAANSYLRWCDLALRTVGAAEAGARDEKED